MMTARIGGLCFVAAAALLACAASDQRGRFDAQGPERATYPSVGVLLVDRCGSLDCHGSAYRNFRLFGLGGARLDPTQRPDAPTTTAAELAADYDATIGVEPEVGLRVARGEAPATDLTLVRKGTEREAHVGGMRLAPGGDGDLCLRGWLARRPDEAACQRALAASPTTALPGDQ